MHLYHRQDLQDAVPMPGHITEPIAAPALAPAHPPPTPAALEAVLSAYSRPKILPRHSLMVSGIEVPTKTTVLITVFVRTAFVMTLVAATPVTCLPAIFACYKRKSVTFEKRKRNLRREEARTSLRPDEDVIGTMSARRKKILCTAQEIFLHGALLRGRRGRLFKKTLHTPLTP